MTLERAPRPEFMGDGHGIHANHITSVARHHGGAQNRIATLLDMHFGKAGGFAVQDGAVYLVERL